MNGKKRKFRGGLLAIVMMLSVSLMAGCGATIITRQPKLRLPLKLLQLLRQVLRLNQRLIQLQ